MKAKSSQLLTERAILQQIIDLLPGNVYWKDTDNRLIGFNNALAQSLGKKRNELENKSYFDLFDKSTATAVTKIDNAIMQTGEQEAIEETPILNGKQHTFLSKKQPLKDHEGNIIGILGVSFDITPQKEAEALRKENAIMEERAKNLKALSSTIAHEFKTPLATIKLGFEHITNMLPPLIEYVKEQETQGAQLPPKVDAESLSWLKEYLEKLTGAVDGFEVITEMLLTKIRGAKDLPRTLVTVQISSIVGEAIKRYPFQNNDPALHNKIEANDFKLVCSEDLITHVLFNLTKNAIVAIHTIGKGEITITARNEQDYNELIVTDTGPGIQQEKLEKIFEKFFTESASGSGLGLNFCKQALEHAQGTIHCESVEGEYTSFILRFPKI